MDLNRSALEAERDRARERLTFAQDLAATRAEDDDDEPLRAAAGIIRAAVVMLLVIAALVLAFAAGSARADDSNAAVVGALTGHAFVLTRGAGRVVAALPTLEECRAYAAATGGGYCAAVPVVAARVPDSVREKIDAHRRATRGVRP